MYLKSAIHTRNKKQSASLVIKERKQKEKRKKTKANIYKHEKGNHKNE